MPGKKRNSYRVLVGNPQGKIPVGRPRHRRDNNIKMELREIRWGGGLDSYRDQWRALVIMEMNPQVP
jgi:hypothetical protein